VQVDPVQPKLKPLGNEHLKLKCVTLLSASAFKFSLRRYSMVRCVGSRDLAGTLLQVNKPIKP